MGGKYSSIGEVWNLVPAHGNQIEKPRDETDIW